MTGNISKTHKFLLEIDGIDALLIQEATLPEVELSVIEIGGGVNDPLMKIPGRKTISNLTCKKLIPTDASETWVYDWLEEANTSTRSRYAKFAFLKLLADDGLTITRTYDLGEIYVTKVSTDTFNRANGEAMYETAEFTVSRFNVQ